MAEMECAPLGAGKQADGTEKKYPYYYTVEDRVFKALDPLWNSQLMGIMETEKDAKYAVALLNTELNKEA